MSDDDDCKVILAAERIRQLRTLRAERQRVYDCGPDEVDTALNEAIDCIADLERKLGVLREALEAAMHDLSPTMSSYQDALAALASGNEE